LQLALFLQRLPRRASFPAESALDENGSVPPKHYRAAKRRRRSHHQTRAYARVPGSGFAKARSERARFGGRCSVSALIQGRDGARPSIIISQNSRAAFLSSLRNLPAIA